MPNAAGFPLPFDELRDELDRFWTTLTAAPARQGWGVRPGEAGFPAVNVCESDDAVTVGVGAACDTRIVDFAETADGASFRPVDPKIIMDPQEFRLRVLYSHERRFGVWGGSGQPVI